MKASLADKLARADERLEELDALLSQPEIAGDMNRYRRLTREHADLTPVVALYRKYRQVEADQVTASEMLVDPDLRELVLPALRADYRAIEDYRVEPGARVRVPTVVYGGSADPQTSPEELADWQQYVDQPIRTRWFDGVLSTASRKPSRPIVRVWIQNW